jgi:hypothetical protein
MKKIKFLAITALLSLVFYSCTNKDSDILENNQINLLKDFKLEKNAEGLYSLNFNVKENTKVEQFVDASYNEFLLSSSNIKSKENFSKDLSIEGDQLNISIIDANVSEKSSLSIIDDNIKLQSKGSSEMLSSYSVQGNEEGTFDLAFDVSDNVKVSFVYNQAINTYEIHLEEGNSSTNNFSRILEKEEGHPLKIDFVNHTSNGNAKSASSAMIRKPKVIIDHGDDA